MSMKEERLFRGYNQKQGIWLMGYIIKNRGEYFIVTDGLVANPFAVAEDFKVSFESIGQFTGIYDKDCTPVFEGDIIRIGGTLYNVDWDNRHGFVLRNGLRLFNFLAARREDCEVVGKWVEGK